MMRFWGKSTAHFALILRWQFCTTFVSPLDYVFLFPSIIFHRDEAGPLELYHFVYLDSWFSDFYPTVIQCSNKTSAPLIASGKEGKKGNKWHLLIYRQWVLCLLHPREWATVLPSRQGWFFYHTGPLCQLISTEELDKGMAFQGERVVWSKKTGENVKWGSWEWRQNVSPQKLSRTLQLCFAVSNTGIAWGSQT